MADKFQFTDNNKMALLNMKAMQKLVFVDDARNGWVKYGKDNLYPQEIIRLFNEHPEHRAIINRKARYIWGNGLKAVKPEDDIKVNAFIDSFNRFETLNQVGKKITPNTELFNGCYIEVITDLNGLPIEFYLLNSANCRISEDQTKLFFSKNWSKNIRGNEVQTIEKYTKGAEAGTYFIEFKYYTPSATYLESVYPNPNYQGIIEDINTDVDISTFNKNYVASGFSVGTIINFYSGTPTDSEKADINNRFKGTYTGETGQNTMITFNDRDDKAPDVVTIGVDELAVKFEFTSKRALKKIFAGHEMASELFNIKFDDSFLSGSPDLITLQNLFVKGYVEPRQNDLLEFLSYLSYLKTGEYLEMMFEPISLIGADLSNDADLSVDERRILKGYPALTAPKLGIDGQPLPIQAATNDTLTNLTGRQLQGLLRIVSKYDNGKINKEAAILTMMQGFSLTREDALTFLDENDAEVNPITKMSSQVDNVLMQLEKVGTIEDPNTYIVLKREKVNFKSSNDALKYERQIMKFADVLIITIKELDSAVLNALKGNPSITVDELAKQLNFKPYQIDESIKRSLDKQLIEVSTSGFKPTPKALEKKTEPIKSKEIYTIYKYEVNDDKPKLSPGGKSRAFCSTLMSKNKEYTFEQIDGVRLEGMENVSGSNIWDYRGGYYMNPKGSANAGTIDPECRHIWVAETRQRK
jgi:DNA-binding Lrp family transcriptional regulator